MTEYVATLTDAEIALVLHPKTGVVVRCEFLPKIADLAKIVDEPRLKAEAEEASRAQFRNHPNSGYRRFSEEPEEEVDVPPLDRRKQVVAEVLGYDPQDARSRRKAEPPAFQTIKIEDLKSSDDLKTPPRPISPEMRKFLEEQGWPHLPPADDAR